MADYPTITVAPNLDPVQVAAATETVTWFARSGAFRISTRSTMPDREDHGVTVPEGFGVDIASGKTVWYWAIGSRPAKITREAL